MCPHSSLLVRFGFFPPGSRRHDESGVDLGIKHACCPRRKCCFCVYRPRERLTSPNIIRMSNESLPMTYSTSPYQASDRVEKFPNETRQVQDIRQSTENVAANIVYGASRFPHGRSDAEE